MIFYLTILTDHTSGKFWPFLLNKVCWKHSEDWGTTSVTISSKRGRDWPLGRTGGAGDLSNAGKIRGSYRISAHQVKKNLYLKYLFLGLFSFLHFYRSLVDISNCTLVILQDKKTLHLPPLILQDKKTFHLPPLILQDKKTLHLVIYLPWFCRIRRPFIYLPWFCRIRRPYIYLPWFLCHTS